LVVWRIELVKVRPSKVPIRNWYHHLSLAGDNQASRLKIEGLDSSLHRFMSGKKYSLLYWIIEMNAISVNKASSDICYMVFVHEMESSQPHRVTNKYSEFKLHNPEGTVSRFPSQYLVPHASRGSLSKSLHVYF
jgi:hypothetical protein